MLAFDKALFLMTLILYICLRAQKPAYLRSIIYPGNSTALGPQAVF